MAGVELTPNLQKEGSAVDLLSLTLSLQDELDLSARKAEGQTVDAKDIRKHGNDAFRLSQLLAPESRIPVAAHW
jgi:hypothetical protein